MLFRSRCFDHGFERVDAVVDFGKHSCLAPAEVIRVFHLDAVSLLAALGGDEEDAECGGITGQRQSISNFRKK